jgi:hypothetical protein
MSAACAAGDSVYFAASGMHGKSMSDLARDEANWRMAVVNATVGLWDLHPQMELVEYSPAWKTRLGFDGTQVLDSTSFWRSKVHPDDYNTMLRALRLHLDGYTATYEARFRLRCGNFRYAAVLSRGRVVERDHRGNPLRMLGTMVDYTGRLPAPAVIGRWRDRVGWPVLQQVGDLLDRAVRDDAASPRVSVARPAADAEDADRG